MDLDKIYREKEINNDYEVTPGAFRNLRMNTYFTKKIQLLNLK